MTERSGSGSEQASAAERGQHALDENASVFTPASERTKATPETAQLDRPSVPVGSPAPPWQRAQQPGGSAGSAGTAGGGSAGGGGGHDAGSEHAADYDAYRGAAVMADQQTVAEHRPSYAPPVHSASGSGNGAGSPSAPNPFLTRAVPAGPSGHGGSGGPAGPVVPPLVPPGHSIPLGGPGAVPVGAPAVPAGGHSGHAAPGLHRPPSARPSAPLRGRAVRPPRKASLQIRRFDPWSVLKLSLVLSVAMFLMWLVAVGVLYGVLDGMGVWDKLNGAYSDLASVNDATGGGEPLISAGRVFGVSAVVGVVNIVLFTAFATVAAFVYNVSADLAGGIEVTLSERD